MLKIIDRGSFDNVERYLKKSVNVNANVRRILERYGQEGVKLLAANTPFRTGASSAGWTYGVIVGRNNSRIVFNNHHMAGTTPVVILLQYGHMTGTGGYVEGIDFINPVTASLFNKMSNDIWREVIAV